MLKRQERKRKRQKSIDTPDGRKISLNGFSRLPKAKQLEIISLYKSRASLVMTDSLDEGGVLDASGKTVNDTVLASQYASVLAMNIMLSKLQAISSNTVVRDATNSFFDSFMRFFLGGDGDTGEGGGSVGNSAGLNKLLGNVTDKELKMIAGTIYAEYGKRSTEEATWMAFVILNRVANKHGGQSTVQGVLSKTGIYGYNSKDYKTFIASKKDLGGLNALMQNIKSGKLTDPTSGENMWGGHALDMLGRALNSKSGYGWPSKQQVLNVMEDKNASLYLHFQAFASGNYTQKGATSFFKLSDTSSYSFRKNDWKKFLSAQ